MPKTTTPEDKDAEIGRLHMELKETQDELSDAQTRLEEAEGAYQMRHSGYKKDPWGSGKLPVPRLQFHYEKLEPGEGYDWAVIYSLVFMHRLGHIHAVPLGITKVGGGERYDGPLEGKMGGGTQLYDPFRDGIHIRSDRNHLNLPAFKVHGDRIEEIVDFDPDHPILPGPGVLGSPTIPPRFGPEGEKYRKQQEKEQDTEE